MTENTYHYTDIGWSIKAEIINSAAVSVWMYEHMGEDENGNPLFELNQDDDPCCIPCDDISNARFEFTGSIKFDGCSDWSFDNETCLHLCGLRAVKNFTAALTRAYVIADELIGVDQK